MLVCRLLCKSMMRNAPWGGRFGTLLSVLFLDDACVLIFSPLQDDKLQGQHRVPYTAGVIPSPVLIGA